MKVHLINPTKDGETYLFNRGLLAPLGLMYLASHTPEEVDVRLIDENVEHVDFSETPDLVGITTMTATALRAYRIADTYRARGSKVVLGGIHASMLPEEALQHADAVVIGEGEEIWPQVVADADAGKLEPIYKQDEFMDFRRPLLPRRDVAQHLRYWSGNGVQTARGCPHACNFCSVTAFNGRGYRMRDLDNVLAEVETLYRRNMTRRTVVPFMDDNIAADPARAKELFKRLIPMKVMWGSQASITIAKDEELVALAAESGCRFLFIGLETLSKDAIREMGKRQNHVERYAEAMQLLRKYNIPVMGAFVFGFDSDNEDVFSETLEFNMSNKMKIAQFAHLVPYPGTRLYDELMEEGRVEPEFWLTPNWDNRVVYRPKRMSATRLAQLTHKVQRDFYSFKSICKRTTIEPQWHYYFAFNLIYRQSLSSGSSRALAVPQAATGPA